MIRRLSCILLTILVCFTISQQTTYAAGSQGNSSFFSFLKNYLIAFINEASHKEVLAAQTQITIAPLTPFPTSLPTVQPTQPIQTAQLSTVSAYILNGVNQYRTSLGLPPVQASGETCAFATTRAQEISTAFNHDGFYSRVNNRTLPYASWAHATENIAEAPNYQEVVTLWKNSPEHAANMRDNTPYVCIEQYGAYYAYEGMRM